MVVIPLLCAILLSASAYNVPCSRPKRFVSDSLVRMVKSDPELSPEETVEKYGLEAGMFKAVTSNDKKLNDVGPGELLKKYGVAYLATSITLAVISYSLCYVAIDNGVDVGALLEKVNIKTSAASSTAGTAALAYAVHKAASPIRFPPTVALTPVVANWIGKEPNDEESSTDFDEN
jgi:hypothetical protein